MSFMTVDVAAGSPLTSDIVEQRVVPAGSAVEVEPDGVAAVDLRTGDLLTEAVVRQLSIPSGWMVIEAPIPSHALPGDDATGVILTETEPFEFPAIVAGAAGADAFGQAAGTLAVPGEWMARAAAASAEGRLVIGVEAAAR